MIDWAIFERFFFFICTQIIIQNSNPSSLYRIKSATYPPAKIGDISGNNDEIKHMKIQKRERDESLWWKKEIQICLLRYARAAKYLNMPDMFSTQDKKTEFSDYKG